MGFGTKLSNGWQIARTSFTVLKENNQLIVFPILSSISILLILGSFVTALMAGSGWELSAITGYSRGAQYLVTFLFYLVNYFVVVFFNMALMHCTKLYFDGKEVSIAAGLRFSVSRIGTILSWALFAATVGTVLKMIQDQLGWLGKVLISVIGWAWSIATFFVVPVLAYENVGPFEALKRSSSIMKNKWGESLAANFSIGLVNFIAILCVGIVAFIIGAIINPIVGIAIFAIAFLAILAISSALNSIFICAVYNDINGDINVHFNKQMLEGLFVEK